MAKAPEPQRRNAGDVMAAAMVAAGSVQILTAKVSMLKELETEHGVLMRKLDDQADEAAARLHDLLASVSNGMAAT